jgi:hypothetical protein
MSDAKPSVIEALSAVMGDVQAVGKTGRNAQQNYNFRGVDAVVNAVGPALRTHGVVVVPIAADVIEERYTTKTGTAMKGVTATVTFRFYGPAGDHIDAQVCGESSDSGDKAVPKAHSVAYRTMLLQALCIPTDEPDPDEESHERAATKNKPTQRNDAVAVTVISQAQLTRLHTIVGSVGLSADAAKTIIKAVAGVESSKDIPRDKYDLVIKAIEDTQVAA